MDGDTRGMGGEGGGAAGEAHESEGFGRIFNEK